MLFIFVLVAAGAFALLNLLGETPDLQDLPGQGNTMASSTALPIEDQEPEILVPDATELAVLEPEMAPQTGEEVPLDTDPIPTETGVAVPEIQIDIAPVPETPAEAVESVEILVAIPEASVEPSADDLVFIEENIVQPEDTPLGLEPVLVDLDPGEQPRFGRVTLDSTGSLTVVQGRGFPGSWLEILLGDAVVAQTGIGSGGTWSLYENALLPPGTHRLSLRATLPDGRTGIGGEQLDVLVLADARASANPAMVLSDGQGGLTILSGPRFVGETLPLAIAFSGEDARLYGKAPAGVQVRLVLGGDVTADPRVAVGADGNWELPIPAQAPATLILAEDDVVTGQEALRLFLSPPRDAQSAQGLRSTLSVREHLVYFFENVL